MTRSAPHKPLFAAALLLGLSACASGPDEYAPLAQVEERFTVARQEQVPALAPVAFQDAERSLQTAKAALGDASEAEIAHLTTVADRQLEVARADAAAAKAREERQAMVGQREQILLSAREQQLAQARLTAEQERLRVQALESQLAEYESRQTERGLVLTLRDITFDLDSASLSPGDQERLRPLADFLRNHPDRMVTIEGHTDSSGADSYNQQLSQRRAEAVEDFLVAQGIEPGRVRATGRGEAVPVASNDTQAGRLQNRRIEVVIGDPGGIRGVAASR
ncbi:OmpA family protein [Aerophototrophica crusticola]|uniref:OmpA family protein n=1 Tax=Aerophototrophica crusticola TaxID=1709002 RepID=A0A858RA39_9PROT|nr:OmpA family protein [Rhodospirillaceae bacterium B3]